MAGVTPLERAQRAVEQWSPHWATSLASNVLLMNIKREIEEAVKEGRAVNHTTQLLVENRHIMTSYDDEWYLNLYIQDKGFGSGVRYVCVLLKTTGKVICATGDSPSSAEADAWRLAGRP